jgi:HNH endonuclease
MESEIQSESPGYREIPLTQGKVAIVDSDDVDRVMQHTWYAVKDHKTFYAKSRMGGYSPTLMHRFILGLGRGEPGSLEVDHINGHGLDNRKTNLRLVTRSQNARNQPGKVIRGWTLDGRSFRNKPYKVQKNGKYIGRFATQKEAEEAYRNA